MGRVPRRALFPTVSARRRHRAAGRVNALAASVISTRVKRTGVIPVSVLAEGPVVGRALQWQRCVRGTQHVHAADRVLFDLPADDAVRW